jgi:small-conductance mechanosensitive channel
MNRHFLVFGGMGRGCVLKTLGAAALALLVVLACSVTVLQPVPAFAQGALGLITAQTSKSSEDAETPAAAETESLAEEEAEAVRNLDDYVNDALSARDNLKQIISELPTFPETALATLRSHGADQALGWLPTTLFSVLIAVGFGFGALSLVARWGRKQFVYLYKPDVYTRADKITYLLLRALLMAAGLIVFFAVSSVIFLAIGGGMKAANQTALVVISTTALFLFLRIVFLNLLAPDAATHRLVSLSDDEASGLYRSLIIGTALSAVVFGLCLWMERLGLPQAPHKLALIFGAFLSALILSGIAIAYRTVIARLIRGSAGDAAPTWRRVLAYSWHLIAVGYFFIAWAISALRILLDRPDATGLVVAPLQVLLIGLAAYAVLILIIDRLLLPRLDTQSVQEEILEDIRRTEEVEGIEEDTESVVAQARAEAADREAHRSPFRDLLDRGAAILVLFGSADLLASLWGLPMASNGSFIGAFIDVLLVVFLGYMSYEAVKILIDQQIAKESPAEKDEEAEIGGAGESRIATLLPIFRNFLLITIVVIAGMVVLSELGVNIAPLFAGAGVVGLAVGFGAQTLIRDIFSGAFYLIDDAFRKGEYIDIGSAKGTVEKISIRSMQLRHHRGALTTIPFGEIQLVENFSRDWAMMKLAFRVTYDTDVEKMRKIIKKYGQALLDHEEYGPMFLQPLKSQGILSMEDSAMVARVKFMTKPGKQFILRKVVYAGLQDLFRENGIRFAHRQVTVHVASDDNKDDGDNPDAGALAQAAAAGAAASGLIEEEAAAGGSGPAKTGP